MAEKAWTSLTPEEKRAIRVDRWRNPDIQFASFQAEADYKARVDRLVAAIDLQKPDRVPVNIQAGFLPAKRAGLTTFEAMRDPGRAAEAWKRFNIDFQPDALVDPGANALPASALEALDYRPYSWPGHGTPRHASFQYNEKEWMLPEEYDRLISDPSDFMMRTYLPRSMGAFAGFAGLPSLFDYVELPFISANVRSWGSQEMVGGLSRIIEAAKHVEAWQSEMEPVLVETMALGFPLLWGGAAKAPFDILGDTLRGTKGIILDLFRRPEKVQAACERLVQVALDWYLTRPGLSPTPVVFMPLHKGADGFMSDEQFQSFYWPTLRKVILGLIDDGLTPCLFAEGRYDSRLEAIQDVPKGKTVWLFDQTDMARAKQTIGKVACIQGNVPLSLLYAGTPAGVTRYCQELIDVAGEGGGFILDIGAKADAAKDENIRAMVAAAKEYGVY
jgi:hypothetical protein